MDFDIIHIENGVPRNEPWRMAEPVDFSLRSNEHIAIVGHNGSGKSMLVDIITGRHPLLGQAPRYDFSPSQKPLVSDNIRYITFRDCYGGDNDRTYFLQQRWNQMEIDESTPTVGKLLDTEYSMTGGDTPERSALRTRFYELFGIGPLLDKYIILLSSGEMRKFQLTRALLTFPRVLIMDNPFIGLDADARQQLKELLTTLSRETALQIILVLSKTSDIPDFITHIVEVRDMRVLPKRPSPIHTILNLPYRDDDKTADEVVRMTDVTIRYGARTILKNLNWTVRNGERWALSGHNGSGKSTLLSLVCADNPQGYACDIALFGTPRGSGESIWDIKRRIGYVSPEMHRAYQRDLPAIRIVASGLKDSIGLYVKPTDDDYAVCRLWMQIFGIEHLAERPFLQLSSGEQRMVLLARAFVKDPQLLILDEPLHGLDDQQRIMVKQIVDTFARRRNKTLIYVTHYQEELPSCITHHLAL